MIEKFLEQFKKEMGYDFSDERFNEIGMVFAQQMEFKNDEGLLDGFTCRMELMLDGESVDTCIDEAAYFFMNNTKIYDRFKKHKFDLFFVSEFREELPEEFKELLNKYNKALVCNGHAIYGFEQLADSDTMLFFDEDWDT